MGHTGFNELQILVIFVCLSQLTKKLGGQLGLRSFCVHLVSLSAISEVCCSFPTHPNTQCLSSCLMVTTAPGEILLRPMKIQYLKNTSMAMGMTPTNSTMFSSSTSMP